MFHFQDPVVDWPECISYLPPGWMIKAVDNVQMLAEAKQHNPAIKTVLRHWYGAQVPGDSPARNRQLARDFFDTFIDGTFESLASQVDFVEEWNEYFANDMSEEQRRRFIMWSQAAAEVWSEEYRCRSGLEHIRLILTNTAVGNDIPAESAWAAARYDALLGYHAYWPTRLNRVPPDAWSWYEGRWTRMDAEFRDQGIVVDWALTEAGPVLYRGDWPEITLGPDDGWRHPEVHAADVERLIASTEGFLSQWRLWNAGHENRCANPLLFTSGFSGWGAYQIHQPQLNRIARYFGQWSNPVAPPSPPGQPINPGLPREQYARVYNVIPGSASARQARDIFMAARDRSRETVGYSYDDAGVGALSSKTARLYGINKDQRQTYIDWYEEYYPGTRVEFHTLPPNAEDGRCGGEK